jgi:hypothetical protein
MDILYTVHAQSAVGNIWRCGPALGRDLMDILYTVHAQSAVRNIWRCGPALGRDLMDTLYTVHAQSAVGNIWRCCSALGRDLMDTCILDMLSQLSGISGGAAIGAAPLFHSVRSFNIPCKSGMGSPYGGRPCVVRDGTIFQYPKERNTFPGHRTITG